MIQNDMMTGQDEIMGCLDCARWDVVEKHFIPAGCPARKIGGRWKGRRSKILHWFDGYVAGDGKVLK